MCLLLTKRTTKLVGAAIASLICQFGYTAPIVTGVTGVLEHKATISVEGTGFGTKVTALPAVWDEGQGTTLSSRWNTAVPSAASNSAYNIQYRPTGYRGVGGPHPRSTGYIVGGHTNTWDPNAGGVVMITKTKGSHAEGDIVYARAYIRLDPQWQFGTTLADNNHKWWILNFRGNGPYETDYMYIDYDQGAFDSPTTAVQHKYNPGHPLVSPDANGHSNWWGSSKNPASGWTLYETETRLSTGSSGYLKVWADGKLVMNYAGPTDAAPGASISVGFGGYSSSYVISPVNNFRYFSDIYIDFTPARVVLANAPSLDQATIVETQIPTRWSASSIDVTVNAGKFSAGQVAYLFVVDGTGAQTASGYRVTVGGEASGSKPMPPPSMIVQ